MFFPYATHVLHVRHGYMGGWLAGWPHQQLPYMDQLTAWNFGDAWDCWGGMAQWIAHQTSNLGVVGSSPSVSAFATGGKSGITNSERPL